MWQTCAIVCTIEQKQAENKTSAAPAQRQTLACICLAALLLMGRALRSSALAFLTGSLASSALASAGGISCNSAGHLVWSLPLIFNCITQQGGAQQQHKLARTDLRGSSHGH